jgi:hypothetical protein
MRKYFTHDLGDEPAIGFGEASEVYLASDADARIAELEQGLRDLIHVPAVRQALGWNHVGDCDCPLCVARQLLSL